MSFKDFEQTNQQEQNQQSQTDIIYNQIFTNLEKIGKNNKTLDEFVKKIGTPKDTETHRSRIMQLSQQTADIIKQTSKMIKQASSQSNQKDDFRLEKIMKDFQLIFETFKKVEKNSKLAQMKYEPKQNSQQKPKNIFNDNVEEDETSKLINDQRREELRQQQMFTEEVQFHNEIIKERDEQIQEIEQTINEVNEMFMDLAKTVQVQGIQIITIDENIDKTEMNTEEAVEELHKASRFQQAARKKSCWLLCCIVVAAIIIAVVLGVKL
ncbi:t-snare domain-containing protein [Anaeramoeba ignava]|uniref:T-snare domain-containing protein n=1 Tax=Anaeramoeba ignava TaxID=1746090 RepID=A0A9Q0LD39_ANAIG|nr:t-snare domain-containing protein [Anaeramoeba ignava]